MKVDQQWADSLRAIEKYQYIREEEGTSLLATLWNWVRRFIYEVADGRADSVVDFLGYGLILFILFLLYKLFKGGGRSSLLSVKRRGAIEFIDDELAEAKDYDRLVGAAIEKSQYRLAVRLMYQRSLAELRDLEVIVWTPEKTDSEYLREVTRKGEAGGLFGSAVLAFQRVWYGKESLNEMEFNVVKEQFDLLRMAINRGAQ